MADLEDFGQTQTDKDLDAAIEAHIEEAAKQEEKEGKGGEDKGSEEEKGEKAKSTVDKKDTDAKPDIKKEGKGDKDNKEKDSPNDDLAESDDTKQKEESEIGIEDFNKVLESDFESLDDLKDSFDQAKELDTLRQSEQEWKEKYEEKDNLLKEYSNPLSHFKDETEYKRQQLLKKHPDLNSKLAGELFSRDIDKMDNLDAIALKEQLETPGLEGGDQGALELLYNRFGIDSEEESPSEWDTLTRNKINIESNRAKKFLKEIKEGIKLPETVDFEEQKEAAKKKADKEEAERTEKWQPIVDKIFDKFDKLSLSRKGEDGKQETFFEYEVDKDFKKNAREDALNIISESGLDPTRENLEIVENDLKNQYFLLNRDKILQAYADDAVAKNNKEWRKKTDNPTPPGEQEPEDVPKTGEEAKNAEVNAEVERDLGNEGY